MIIKAMNKYLENLDLILKEFFSKLGWQKEETEKAIQDIVVLTLQEFLIQATKTLSEEQKSEFNEKMKKVSGDEGSVKFIKELQRYISEDKFLTLLKEAVDTIISEYMEAIGQKLSDTHKKALTELKEAVEVNFTMGV